MPGIEYSIDMSDIVALSRGLREMENRSQDLSVPMKVAAQILVDSVLENFQAGGRPDAWEELADATLLAKLPKTKILIDSGDLFDSIHGESGPDWARASTDRVYARIHQEGGVIDQEVSVSAHERLIQQAFGKPIQPKTVHVREHQRHMQVEIPARPFMLAQDEDLENIGDAVADYLMGF